MSHIDQTKLAKITPINPNNALQADDAQLAEFLTFTDKDSYVEWRAEWRSIYAELSTSIRSMRKEWRAAPVDRPHHHQLFFSRAYARTMLALRAASKQRAEALYQASKAQAEVA